ncbi:unnamed protein product [Prunus brigantina]
MVVSLFRTRVSTLFILQRTSDNILKQWRLDSRKNSAFSKDVDFPKLWPIHTSSPDNFKYLRFGAKFLTKFLTQCNSLMHVHEHEIHLKNPSSSMKHHPTSSISVNRSVRKIGLGGRLGGW